MFVFRRDLWLRKKQTRDGIKIVDDHVGNVLNETEIVVLVNDTNLDKRYGNSLASAEINKPKAFQKLLLKFFNFQIGLCLVSIYYLLLLVDETEHNPSKKNINFSEQVYLSLPNISIYFLIFFGDCRLCLTSNNLLVGFNKITYTLSKLIRVHFRRKVDIVSTEHVQRIRGTYRPQFTNGRSRTRNVVVKRRRYHPHPRNKRKPMLKFFIINPKNL